MFIINIFAMMWQSEKSFLENAKGGILEKFLLRKKVYLEWPRKKILFPMYGLPEICAIFSFCCCMFLLICIKFMNKNHNLLFADSLKADISGHVIDRLELMDIQDKEVRICQTGSMISLKDCLLEA
jgi:hypothetical protein